MISVAFCGEFVTHEILNQRRIPFFVGGRMCQEFAARGETIR